VRRRRGSTRKPVTLGDVAIPAVRNTDPELLIRKTLDHLGLSLPALRDIPVDERGTR